MMLKWRSGLIFTVEFIVVVAQVCFGQNFRLSLDSNDGHYIMLTCTASGTAVPVEEWLFWVNTIDNPLPTSSYRPVVPTDSSTITVTVTLTAENEGYYYCGLSDQASNSEGPFTANPNFTPHEKISFYHVGVDGSSLLLPNPVPLPTGNTLQYYNINWMNGTSFVLDPSSSKYSIITNGSLNIFELDQFDSGQYSLKVNVTDPNANTDDRYFIYSNSQFYIQVQALPHIIEQPNSIVKFGTDGPESLTCQATGYPSVSIQWSHNDHVIREEDSKYEISSNPIAQNTISSTLIIRTLNETDNGNVTCMAQISGCDADKSYDYCEPHTFPVSSSASLSVITRSFNYEVVVLDGGNLRLQIDLEGRLIPQPVRVYFMYINEDETEEMELPSTQTNMDLVILLYISSSHIPYERFRIRVALGTSTGNSNLYKAPRRDRIIDVNNADEICRLVQWIAIVASLCLTLIITFIILGGVLCYFRKSKKDQDLTSQRRRENHEIRMVLIDKMDPEDRKRQQDIYFPKRNQDICPDSAASQVQGHDVSKWLTITNRLLQTISNVKRKEDLIAILTDTIKAEKWNCHQETSI